MRVMVTGGAGFIGSCLVSELLQNDIDVLVFDNFSTGKKEFLPYPSRGLKIVEGDIVDQPHLLQVTQEWQPDVVVHLAALHFIPYCKAHCQETLRVNVEGLQSVLEVSQTCDVERIVFASSAAVYGITDAANQETDPPDPIDIYGLSKWFGERLLWQFHQETGISCLAARLFNVYGFNETNPHVIPAILEQMEDVDGIQLGNVDACRDFIFVRDVALALLALARAKDLPFGIFNVGSGREYSIRDVVKVCEEVGQRPLPIQTVASRQRKQERWHLWADISHIKETIGWQPMYDLHTGLMKTMLSLEMDIQPFLT